MTLILWLISEFSKAAGYCGGMMPHAFIASDSWVLKTEPWHIGGVGAEGGVWQGLEGGKTEPSKSTVTGA